MAGELGRASARLFLGFNRRFDPNFRRLKDCVEDGDVGELETHAHHQPRSLAAARRLRESLRRPVQGHGDPRFRHGPLAARRGAGSEVFAAGANLVDPAIGAAGDIDTAKTLLRTASGKICVISNSRRSGYGYDQRIELFGSKGSRARRQCRIERPSRPGLSRRGRASHSRTSSSTATPKPIALRWPILPTCSTGPQAQRSTMRTELAALGLAEAAGKSLRSGEPVRLD